MNEEEYRRTLDIGDKHDRADILLKAVALDTRRQRQITNQILVIERQMKGGNYDDVLRMLTEQLAAAEARYAHVRQEMSKFARQLPDEEVFAEAERLHPYPDA